METRTVRLGDFATFVNEKCYLNEASRNTYVSTENLKPNRLGVFFPITKLPQTNKVNTFAKGDILIANIRPYFKKIWHANIAGTHSTDVLNIRSNSKQLLQSYLAVVLSDDRFFDYMMATSKGTKMPRGDKKAIMDFKFELPSFKDQIIISDSISVINQKIELNRQINKNLQKLKDDIWISQRVDKKTSLSNLMTIQSGKRPIDRYDNKVRLKELYPIIGANGVMGWTSKALTARTIITTGRVGTHGVVNMFDEPVWVSDNSFVISSKYEEVAYEILRCDVKFLTLVHGTTQPLITQKDLKQYVVSIPSNNQLKKVNEHLKVYTNLINVNNKQNKFLTALRNLLLPKLLSGEIDLSDVKEVIQGD